MIRLSAFSDEAGTSLTEQIDALHRGGIFCMEVRGIDGCNVAKFTTAKALEYAAVLQREGIAAACIASPLGKAQLHERESQRELLYKLLELCRIFGTDKMRIFSFYNTENRASEVLDELSRWGEIAAANGVKLYHENEKDVYGDRPERVRNILRASEHLSNIFDPANYIQSGQDAGEAIKILADETHYFHMKDCLPDGTVVPAGEGAGHLPALIDAVKGKDVLLALEPHLTDFDGLSDFEPHKVKRKHTFLSAADAFDYDVSALKKLLQAAGCRPAGDGLWEAAK